MGVSQKRGVSLMMGVSLTLGYLSVLRRPHSQGCSHWVVWLEDSAGAVLVFLVLKSLLSEFAPIINVYHKLNTI